MPIINQIVKGSGGGGAIPDYYVKKTIDGNGKLVFDSSQTTFSTSPATDVGNNVFENGLGNHTFSSVDCSSLLAVSGNYAFNSAFTGSTITSFDFSNVIVISGTYAFYYAFNSVSGCTTISFDNLETISGVQAFDSVFNGSSITSVLMPKLKTVDFAGFLNAFIGSNITTLSLPALETIGGYAFQNAFAFGSVFTTLTLGGTTAITIDPDAFTTMFDGCSQNITVNAPLANKADIEAMSGYPEFGAATGVVTWNWVS